MPRLIAATSAAALLALALAGCTATQAESPAPSPSATAPASSSGGGGGAFPTCDAITAALGSFLDGVSYDADASTNNTADEAYEQRVCVYVASDPANEIGVTLAAIPFQQTELDSYATLPNAVADPRLADSGGVLQTFSTGDGDDGHLDSALYLFDTTVSITIEGVGDPAALPQLTLPATSDAAFAVRALVR